MMLFLDLFSEAYKSWTESRTEVIAYCNIKFYSNMRQIKKLSAQSHYLTTLAHIPNHFLHQSYVEEPLRGKRREKPNTVS